MLSENQGHNSPLIPAAARLSVVMPVAAIGFFIGALLDYALPLYFRFLSDGSARGGVIAGREDIVLRYGIRKFPWSLRST